MSDLKEEPSEWEDDDNDDNIQEMYDGLDDDDDCGMVKACSFDTIYEGRLDDDFEKFDMQAAKDYLRHYADKLQSERELEKRHRFKCNRDPHHFEQMYEMGKAKVRSVRSMTSTSPNNLHSPRSTHVPSSIDDVIKRLYEQSREMQKSGKQRREEIVRMRELSHLLPHERPSLSATVHSIHSLRSPESLAQTHIIDRLYGRSKSMRQYGRGRREQIQSRILSKPPRFNLKISEPSTNSANFEANEALMRRADLRLSLQPQDIIDRLYARGADARKYGRERREEIEIRSQSQPRMVMNTITAPSPSPSPTKRISFMDATRPGESPSPQEVMDRLYGRSSSGQKIGRERRELIEAKSQSTFQLYSSPPPSPTRMKTRTKEVRDCNESHSPDEVTERLYGRSYQYQQVGRERREEIDKARALSNARSPIHLSGPPTSVNLVNPVRPRIASTGSSGHNDSPSPEEISRRLYDRSVKTQQAGKDRREEVYRMRCMSLPRLNLHGSTPVECEEFTFHHTKPHKVSMKDTVERLYGRSLHNQEVGRERRVEISKMRELSNPIMAMKVRDSSPGPQGKTSFSVTAE